MSKHPSLSGLRTFNVAARTLSFKRAADELGLTPTAISHQIKTLEQALGASLFERRVRQVELTARGRELADAIAPAFRSIADAVERFSGVDGRHVVTLGAGPVFASRWLVPRLDAFWQALPDVDLRLHHSPMPVYQQLGQFDLAVAWGDGHWADMHIEPLLRIQITPVHAPEVQSRPVQLDVPGDVLSLPLLHQRNHNGWLQWLQHAGVDPAGADLAGSTFEDANVLLQAMLDGKGAGLGILPFVADDIASGRLIQPWPMTVDPGDAYYLIYNSRTLEREPVRTVRDWLQQQMKH
ncbi:MAG: LysR family transcriptional regulator [Alphaproteobacteria bacterium]|nr:LysR family transcriptional regulator [Alphaproteobacteria bacterium]